MARSKSKQKRIEKLRRKYKLVLMDANSFEEKLSLRLTRIGVISVTFLLLLILAVITIYLVAFTSLREYIPGYTDTSLPEKIYRLQQKTDSLERAFHQKDVYISNLKSVINGDSMAYDKQPMISGNQNYDTITLAVSSEDSALRAEYEEQTRFSLYQNRTMNYASEDLGNINFFPPLSGIITRNFDPSSEHYGVDIVANNSEAIKATMEGTVIFSNWTLETGYVIGLQHKHNLISVYKHNSSLLKQQGTFVQAGETISIIGESGELSTGPHLHFEIWHNGKPINPEEFITF
jgi:murein DD-endopeptidase MepM/ murein hydrolase activator NlpD